MGVFRYDPLDSEVVPRVRDCRVELTSGTKKEANHSHTNRITKSTRRTPDRDPTADREAANATPRGSTPDTARPKHQLAPAGPAAGPQPGPELRRHERRSPRLPHPMSCCAVVDPALGLMPWLRTAHLPAGGARHDRQDAARGTRVSPHAQTLVTGPAPWTAAAAPCPVVGSRRPS